MKPRTTCYWFVLLACLLICAGSAACADAASDTASSGGDGGQVVARVGDRVFTEKELEEAVKAKNAKAYQAYYDAKRAVLEDLIRTELVDAEAKSRGITDQELLADATKDVQTPTDAEVEAFYNSNTNRMGGRSLEQMKPQISAYLEANAKQAAANEVIRQLKDKYGVKFVL
jgi:isopentenyl diphosphate isomerase/L-lactate dehydrogenase-like FMN-dependent dehydrogenase